MHTCSRNETELNKCMKEWEAKGFPVTGSVCDASSPPQREKLMEEVASLFNGKLNILVIHTFSSVTLFSIRTSACFFSILNSLV